MKKLLFISHEATRTGAPMLLLNLVEWMAVHKKDTYSITVLCVKGGELVSEFQKLTKTIVLDRKYQFKSQQLNKYINKATKKYSLYKLQKPWDLIFSNTIVNGKVFDLLKQSKTPVISYIHELEPSVKVFQKRGQVEGTFQNTNMFLCGSKLVQQNLIKNHKVNQQQTRVVNSFVSFKANHKNEDVANAIKKDLCIPNDALVVGMMGSFIDRKGTDFFIKTAQKLSNENIYFIWVGADVQNLNEITKQNIKNLKLKLIPPSKEYKEYYNTMDVFYLSSKEDPYPMVMVEATSFGMPILCYENAGGTQEFIDDKVGHVIPFADISATTTTILEYYKDRDKVMMHADYIRKKSEKAHDVNNNARYIVKVIDQIIENK